MRTAPAPLSVLVPAYGEARTIEGVLREVLALGDLVHEVVVVDDGSTDGTADVARRVAADDPRVRVIVFERNQGKTAAVRRAIQEATGEILIVQDADREYDPAEIPDVVEPILAGQADVVYGSRFLVRRAARVLFFHHYLANKLLTFLSNVLTNRNMSDVETGYKAFRAEVIKPMPITSRGFGMEIEITARLCTTRARTYEVPISYYGRTYEEGKKIGFLDGVAALGYLVRYAIVARFLPSGRRYRRTVDAALAARAAQARTARAGAAEPAPWRPPGRSAT